MIVGVVDESFSTAQIYEYHARGTCRGASAWVAYQYPRTSSIVTNAKTDGSRNIFTINLGEGKLDLKPSVSPAGIESAVVAGDELKLTYAGLAGGGSEAAATAGHEWPIRRDVSASRRCASLHGRKAADILVNLSRRRCRNLQI